MTMHLVGPYLSTTGKKKGKQKFKSAAAAKASRDNQESWNKLLKKYEPTTTVSKKPQPLSKSYSLNIPSHRSTDHIKSVDTGIGSTAKKENQKYTGTLIQGIAVMHKSNAVPILNNEDAIAVAHMRR